MPQPFASLKYLNPSSLKQMSAQIMGLLESKLWAKILAGMLLGIIFGLLLSPQGPLSDFVKSHSATVDTTMNWLSLPAKFFLKLIRMVIVPLIFASVIRGLASTTDISQMKSLGLKFSSFVLVSTSVAAGLGIFLSNVIKPGRGLMLSGAKPILENGPGITAFSVNPDTVLSVLPLNPLASMVEGQMLDVVVLSIIAGIALLSIKEAQAKSIIDGLESIQSICMTVISWAMKVAPYAVFGMMAQVSFTTGVKALQSMALYTTVCFLGFLIVIILYLLLLALVRKTSPLAFLKIISTPMLLAFSTSSSAATMPVSMKTAEEDLNVDPSTARFLIPLGATINMAGSAIWHTTAIVFLSQAYNVDLSFGQILFVVATSIGSAIGSPGVPGVGIGVLSAVLAKIGVPIEGVSLIMGIDRLVDMGCTVVNVTGDLTSVKLFGQPLAKAQS